MKTLTLNKISNWKCAESPGDFVTIHNEQINVVYKNRNISHLNNEVEILMKQPIKLENIGSIPDILSKLKSSPIFNQTPNVLSDIYQNIKLFSKISASDSLQVLIATVSDDMCRKFHTDRNTLRLLCTYKGPGTEWLTNEQRIMKQDTGDVILLKGSLYQQRTPNPAIHKSPSISNQGYNRLLLRIDSN